MKCELCGAVLPEGAQACPACGQPVPGSDPFAAYDDAALPQEQPLESEPSPDEASPRVSRPRQAMPQEEPMPTGMPGNPYAMPVRTPSPIMVALRGLPQFLRALVTEPKTTLGTMLGRGDVYSGLFGLLLFAVLAVLGDVMLGTSAARVSEGMGVSYLNASSGHAEYVLALFSALTFFCVGRLLVWLLIFAVFTAGMQVLWLVVVKRQRFTWTLVTTGLCYALLPIGAIALPAGLCSLFSPVLGFALALCGVVMSLYLTGYVLRQTSGEQDSDGTVFLAGVPAVAIVLLTLLVCALLA